MSGGVVSYIHRMVPVLESFMKAQTLRPKEVLAGKGVGSILSFYEKIGGEDAMQDSFHWLYG